MYIFKPYLSSVVVYGEDLDESTATKHNKTDLLIVYVHFCCYVRSDGKLS